MSTYADSSQAVVWIDGDAFRGAANGTEPPNPFASAPTSSSVTLLAYGAIEAGFTITPDTNVKEYDAWNNETGGVFFSVDGNTKTTIKFRSSQISKATALTILRGGSIAETSGGSGIWKQTQGSGEEFALLLQLKGSDGVKREAHWIPRCKLLKQPERIKNDDKLDGYEWEIEALAPTSGQAVVTYNSWNLLA